MFKLFGEKKFYSKSHTAIQQGFTIIELIIVIVVLSILAGSVIMLWPGDTINVAAQAELLASDLRYTQILSMSQGQRYGLVVIPSSNTYQIRYSNVGFLDQAIQLPSGDVSAHLGAHMSISTTNLVSNQVFFDTTGIPYTGTSYPGTALTADATITIVSSSGVSSSVIISPQTGRVKVQ